MGTIETSKMRLLAWILKFSCVAIMYFRKTCRLYSYGRVTPNLTFNPKSIRNEPLETHIRNLVLRRIIMSWVQILMNILYELTITNMETVRRYRVISGIFKVVGVCTGGSCAQKLIRNYIIIK